jgi:hypothetical protein
MHFDPERILAILDGCCDAFTFPMLDNGYVYLAATRLSLYRSATDWALVIEVFGFSPRAGMPDTAIFTFASRLHDRDLPEDYVNREAYERYLTNHPHDEFRQVFPIEEGPWQDSSNCEFISEGANEIVVHGKALLLPPLEDYTQRGIDLEEPPRVQVFELCRYLADVSREQVLASAQERRVSVLPDMVQILLLDEWNHPNLVEGELPSGSETFRQLAHVLADGDVDLYRPTVPPNTHWRNWPEGGRL